MSSEHFSHLTDFPTSDSHLSDFHCTTGIYSKIPVFKPTPTQKAFTISNLCIAYWCECFHEFVWKSVGLSGIAPRGEDKLAESVDVHKQLNAVFQLLQSIISYSLGLW